MASAVVVGVDSSDDAMSVATQAGSLAERLGLRPVLAHVVEDRPGFAHGNEAERERHSREGRAAAMLAQMDQVTAVGEHRVLFGEPAHALEELAADVDAALIAVGSRGHGPLKSALMGSVSLALATRSARPVLVVPPGATHRERTAQPRSPRAIVCGVDGSEHADRAVQAAADITGAAGLRLVLVHAQARPASLAVVPSAGAATQVHHQARLVESQQEAAEETLERAKRLAAGDLELDARLEAGDAAALLEQLAVEEDAALIAVGSRGHSTLRATLLGSTSARLVRLASRPVLIVPPDARLTLETGAPDGVA